MRVVLAGLTSTPGDVAGNTDRLIKTLEQYQGCGVDVLLTCESYLQGFESVTFDPAADRSIAIDSRSEQHDPLAEAVTRTGIAVGYGYFERANEQIFSTYRITTPDGLLLEQRRISVGWREPWADPAIYAVGDEVQVINWHDRRIAVALCGDLWTDQDRFTDLGIELLLWPVFVAWSPQQWTTGQLDSYAARAATAASQTLLINGVTLGEDYSYVGGSALLAQGQVIAATGFDGRDTCLLLDI